MKKLKTDDNAKKSDETIVTEETSVALSDEIIDAVKEAIDADNKDISLALLDSMSPADAADLLDKIDSFERKKLIEWFGDKFTPDMFLYLSDENIRSIFGDMKPTQVARIIADMDTDDAMELLELLDEDFRVEVIKKLSKKTSYASREGVHISRR